MTSWSTPHPNWKLDRTHQHKLFSSSPAQWHFDQGSDGARLPLTAHRFFDGLFLPTQCVKHACVLALSAPSFLSKIVTPPPRAIGPFSSSSYTWRLDIVSCRKLDIAESNNNFQVCFVSSYRLLLSACSRRLVDWASVLLHTHSFPSQSYSA